MYIICVCVCVHALFIRRLSNFSYLFVHRCLSHLPRAVGKNPAHFDLSLARKQPASGLVSCDWLVLHVQELISLAYQVPNMKPLTYYHISLKGCMLNLTFFRHLFLVSDKHNPVWKHAANWCGASEYNYG